ncbi:MAG TPA: hypothetical protein VLB46_16620 [Pyrinomonadaceae bacterium]|nr:hypothetical protein [Pyrinomonadaceae bacterium]
MNLATTYMGIPLQSPLIVGSSPLTDDLDTVRQLEDAGAAALILPSLYEEEITGEQMADFFSIETYGNSFPEASSYIPEPESAPGPHEYLEHLRRVKQAVRIPVIASLNSSTPGGWISYACLMQEAGADAIELHLYHAASDPDTNSAEVERQMLQIIWEVKGDTGGVHTALDVIKATMAGAHVVQMVSALMRNGPRYLQSLRAEVETWMIANEWESLELMRGNMSFQRIPNPAIYERENFRRMFQ